MVAKVLVVDDDPLSCDLVAHALQAKGVSCRATYNGSEALGILPEDRPDLIVLDCALPGKSGLEVLRHVRGDPRFARIPVVMASARKSKVYEDAMLSEGAQAYFAKPFDVGVFQSTVMQLIARN